MKILKPKFWERKNNLIALLLLPISFFLQLLILKKNLPLNTHLKFLLFVLEISIWVVLEKRPYPS